MRRQKTGDEETTAELWRLTVSRICQNFSEMGQSINSASLHPWVIFWPPTGTLIGTLTALTEAELKEVV